MPPQISFTFAFGFCNPLKLRSVLVYLLCLKILAVLSKPENTVLLLLLIIIIIIMIFLSLMLAVIAVW